MRLINIKKKKLKKDLILKNKLFSVFLLNTGHSVITNKQINLYKTAPIGLALKYNDLLYRLGYFSYKVIPMVIDYKVLNRKSKNLDKVHDRHSKTVFDICNNLGGVYVKIGQVFGSRDDIFPTVYQKRLEPLLEKAKGVKFKDIRNKIDYLINRLDYIDETAIGIASLGQVYRAGYLDNAIVIKILKPKVARDTKLDLYVTNKVLQKTLSGLTKVMKDFSYITVREFNFMDEADVTLELTDKINIDNIYFPKVYKELSTKEVLVLEYIDGVSLLNYMKKGSIENISYCIYKVLELMWYQIFELGLFSSDPHPGNFFIREVDNKLIVVPLDFGQVGRLTKDHIENVKQLLYALKEDNSDKILRSLDLMGFKSKNSGNEIDKLKLRYAHCMFNDYMKESMVTFSDLTKKIAWTDIPIEYMLVNKTFITLGGLLSLCNFKKSLIDLFIMFINLKNS